MRGNKLLTRVITVSLFAVAALVTGTAAHAQEYKVLYSFGPTGQNAIEPAGLTFDAAGNLYGVSMGGAHQAGTVFELMPTGSGWTEQVLYDFCPHSRCADGSHVNPGLIFDASGNLYGTTQTGGARDEGTVFELSPDSGGSWTETVLYSFGSSGHADGNSPFSGVTFDASGNLYGTTWQGGTYGGGTVFELSPQSGGGWVETILHNFGTNDGDNPYAGLIFDSAGNLYGTTEKGNVGAGTVFELKRGPGGNWTEKVIHSFRGTKGQDGYAPTAGLILDAAGNLYGTTPFGGAYGEQGGGGTVFELTPSAGGAWSEKVLYNFGAVGHGKDGYQPLSGLVLDQAGNLYGTTHYGGAGGQECNNGAGVDGCGTLFRLMPQTDGSWTEQVLYLFGQGSHMKEGALPCCGLIFDASGNLYGTTTLGGANAFGTAFEIKP